MAVNPYAQLDIYGEDRRRQYLGKSSVELAELEPHIFRTAELAYRLMIEERKSQSIIITGESGAGKTESNKLILRYLANVKNDSFAGASTAPGARSSIEDKIVFTNPILEAFGNAKTAKNDNSSRFGKFIQVYFDQRGTVNHAEIKNYLLEKSRIAHQDKGERNYHIFHMLINSAAPELLEKYSVDPCADYPWLKLDPQRAGCDDSDFAEEDNKRWAELTDCMEQLQFSEVEIDGIFRCVSAVLNLSNVVIEDRDAEDSSRIQPDCPAARVVADLLGVAVADLEQLFCQSWIQVPSSSKDPLITNMGRAAAEANKSTLAKDLYDQLFEWIVERINQEIKDPKKSRAQDQKRVALLDIFGFEIFETNSFEQLCINYTNERLQQQFNRHMFEHEQKEYKEQNILWSHVAFDSNTAIIELIHHASGHSLLKLLDEQSRLANGSDRAFLANLEKFHAAHPNFLKPHKLSRNVFGIKHFAGEVTYTVDNFVDKNKKTKNKNTENLFRSSGNQFVAKLFALTAANDQAQGKSVSASFVAQLEALIKNLNESGALYVRCIKPNSTSSSTDFDAKLVDLQLRCAGMLETIKIRQKGFPIRRSFDAFCKSFSLVFQDFQISGKDQRAAINRFLEQLHKKGIFKEADRLIQLGKSKVFLNEKAKAILDKLETSYKSEYANKIKRFLKRRVTQIKLRRVCMAVFRLMKLWKLERRAFFVVCTLRDRKRTEAAASTITRCLKSYCFRKRLQRANFKEYQSRNKTASAEAILKTSDADHSQLTSSINPVQLMRDHLKRWTQQTLEEETYDGIRVTDFDSLKIEDHPKFMEVQLENHHLRKELRELQVRLEADNQTSGLKREIAELRRTEKELSSKLRDREAVIREFKQEKQQLTSIIKAKEAEIDQLRHEQHSYLAAEQEQVLEDISKVDQVFRAKGRYIHKLESENEELRECIKRRINRSDSDIGSQRFYEQMQKRVDLLHDDRSFEAEELAELRSKNRLYKDIASKSIDVMESLITLSKFKSLQYSLIKRQYVDKQQIGDLEAMQQALWRLATEEAVVKEQINEGVTAIKELQAELFEEASCRDEDDEGAE